MICFCWDGFPQYAARCIHGVVEALGERVVVVATRPKVPIEGMEKACGCEVVWIQHNEDRSLNVILGETPKCIFLGGWNLPVFVRFRDEVRRNGGRAIEMCDNNWNIAPVEMFKAKWWRLLVMETIKSLRFRLFLRPKYDGFFVPGESGVRLLRFYGVPKGKIATGLYAADATLFKDGLPIDMRRKKIIYVGQFIERKNVRRLVEAFAIAGKNSNGGWSLDLYGSGVLKDELIRLAAEKNIQLAANSCEIAIHDFAQPERLAELYRESRIFCLPSLEEHWGLVVHEAALSGCVLLISDKTGAAADLLTKDNGIVFDPYSLSDMVNALSLAMDMGKCELVAAQVASLAQADKVGIGKFVEGVRCAFSM